MIPFARYVGRASARLATGQKCRGKPRPTDKVRRPAPDRGWGNCPRPWGRSGAARRCRRAEKLEMLLNFNFPKSSFSIINIHCLPLFFAIFFGFSSLSSDIAHANQARDISEETIYTCLKGSADYDHLSAELRKSGWHPIEAANLDESTLVGYRATQLSNHLMLTPPNPRFKSTWELSEANARGLRRLIQTDGTMAERHFFAHNNEGNFLELNLMPAQQLQTVICQFTVDSDIGKNSITQIANAILEQDTHPIVPLRQKKFDTVSRTRNLNIFVFRRQEIEELIEDPFPYVGVVHVYSSQKR